MDALKYQKAPLALMISTLMWAPMTDASDIEIYKQAQQGQTTLVLMLDTSGSMDSGSIGADYNSNKSCSTSTDTATDAASGLSYKRTYCTIGGVRRYDRISRLKDALFTLMNDATIKDAYIGLGNFSAKGDGKYGQILVPSKQVGPLRSAQRTAIKQAAAGLSATAATPTAAAYAEAAAYLMGTSTGNGSPIYNVVQRKLTTGAYQNCTANSSTVNSSLSTYKIFTCSGTWTAAPQNTSLTYLYKDKNDYQYFGQPSGKLDYDVGGMDYAEGKADIIQNGKYVSPLPANNKTCSGQGVYFLTDGEPNGDANATSVMAKSLNLSSLNTSGTTFVNTSVEGTDDAWPAIEAYSKVLNTSSNPYGAPIKTAVVGFGNALASVPKNADGTWNCNGAASASDPRQACLWGNKGSGRGEGGFYLGSSPQDVVDSIKKFVEDLTVAIPSTSTGSIVIPQDQLNSSALQPFGYLSALDPQPGTSLLIWQGNVKRYQISEGTVKDTAGNLVFNSTGGFNDTTDYWNTSGQSDQGTTVNGGMYSQIPVPTTTSPSTSRPLYINNVDSAGTLTTVNLAALQVGGVLALWTDNRRIRLANALGYGADADTALLAKLNDSSKPVPTLTGVPYRVLGGIVHATPQLLTYQGSGDPDPTKIDPNRKDYVMSGSMDGVLHIVDAKTGVEKMSFLPKELLDLQAEALKQGTTGTALVYGVDAPWTVDTTYELDRSGQLFKAKTMNIYGGLRMGSGDTSQTSPVAIAARSYYGLDVLDLSNPKLLFRIGADKPGFDRMGQTWAKPTLTEIRYKGKRTKVMIVPGGYDMQFEDPYFTPDSNTLTLGNAVYIVDASNGTLLWSTSASGSLKDNTNLKYSITGRVSTLDRDADGLADHLYFADLGGQVFRVDVDNDNQVSTTSTAPLAKRVVRLADLGDSKTGIEKPRFYEAPTVTVHDVGAERFILVNVASGDRSSPLDVIPTTKGGQGKKRSADNAVYGIIDRDVARTDLYTMDEDDAILQTKELKLDKLLPSPKFNGNTQGDMLGAARADRGEGWYYNLNDTAPGSVTGALKGYGEMIAINGDLYVNVYNPQVQPTNNDCSAQVVGETVVRRYCLPFGLDNGSSCTVPAEGYYGFRLGKGMLEASLGPTVSGGKINSETRQLIFQDPNRKQDDKGTPGQLRQFSTPKGLVTTRWFERQPKVSRPSK